MDGGVAVPPRAGEGSPQAEDGGASDAAQPCTATDTGACADPCEAMWRRAWEGDDDFSAGAFARLGCDVAKLSDP